MTLAPRRGNLALQIQALRQLHTYIGALIAPSLLFFAVTGALQLFGLHEARDGRDYHPPAVIAGLASVHKDQVYRVKDDGDLAEPAPPKPAPVAAAAKPAPVAAAAKPAETAPDHPMHNEKLGTAFLKWFFLLVATGLVSSTLLGLWLTLKYGRSQPLILGLLAAGTIIPILLCLI